MAKKSPEERLQALEAKKAQLQARISREKSKAKTEERKRDTRRKIVAGAIVLEHAQKDGEFGELLDDLLARFVTRPEDRELFDLPSVEAENDHDRPAAFERSARPVASWGGS